MFVRGAHSFCRPVTLLVKFTAIIYHLHTQLEVESDKLLRQSEGIRQRQGGTRPDTKKHEDAVHQLVGIVPLECQSFA